MGRRGARGLGRAVGLVVVAALLPGPILAAGPVGTGGVVLGAGQPDNDTQLSVLTPAQAAFMQRKLDLANSLSTFRPTSGKASTSGTQRYVCEHDPCEDQPWFPPPPGQSGSSGPPASKLLLTKARQQNNNYFCGPASGQVVINWSRGIINGNNDGENATTNWRKQSKVAEWMKTTTAGTGGANLATGLNHPQAVLKPAPEWIYAYVNTGSPQEFHNKVVTDIAAWEMPLVLATAPHISGAGQNFLESWPNVAPGAHHWIVIRGYSGLWASPSPIIRYQDSSAGYGGATGAYDDYSSVMWQVNDWNQGGHIIW